MKDLFEKELFKTNFLAFFEVIGCEVKKDLEDVHRRLYHLITKDDHKIEWYVDLDSIVINGNWETKPASYEEFVDQCIEHDFPLPIKGSYKAVIERTMIERVEVSFITESTSDVKETALKEAERIIFGKIMDTKLKLKSVEQTRSIWD